MAAIHNNAQTGFAKATDYDAHRPSFPKESVDLLLSGLRLKGNKGATVIDLAAGTGKFTELLAAREEGFKIIAVEPHDDMRAVLEGKKLPGVQVLKGFAAEIPLDGLVADAVIAAQSFHWFADMQALKEINRVLHPHGTFGMIWNIEDYNATKDHKAATTWEQKVHDFIWTLEDDSPRFRNAQWRKVFDEQVKDNPLSILASADPLFALPLAEHEERWSVALSEDDTWARINTLSQVAILDGEEREKAVKLFKDAVKGEGTERNADGKVLVHGGTYSAWTSKIPAQ